MGLKGKTAIVTGGAQGIGKAISLRLARDGANIGILDIKKDVAQNTVEEMSALDVNAMAIECDTTDYGQVKEAVTKVHQAYGSIDILINNTGIDKSQYFVDTDEALWEQIIDVNYKSFLIASHVCIPIMMGMQTCEAIKKLL